MTAVELLRKAAEALEDGRNPLASSFLGEHDVTLDQLHALAGQLAIGARIVASGLEKPRSPEGAAVMRAMVEAL